MTGRWAAQLVAGGLGVACLASSNVSRAQSMSGRQPISAMPAKASDFTVQVPIDDDSLRSKLLAQPGPASWEAHLDRGGAAVGAVQPMAVAHERLEIALTFDVSGSFFHGPLGNAEGLAEKFIDQLPDDFSAHFSVQIFGTTRRVIGDASDRSDAKALVRRVSLEKPQPRTNLRSLLKEVIDDTGRKLIFPEGVREVIVFTDGGEESTAFPDYKSITDPAMAAGVVVHAFVFQPNAPSPQAATLADKLVAAVELTGGYAVRVDPGDPFKSDTLGRLKSAASLPDLLYRVSLAGCQLATPGPGKHVDTLSLSVSSWRSAPLPLALDVPATGVPACPTSVATGAAQSGVAPAPAPSGATPTAPRDSTGTISWWPWALGAGAAAMALALAILASRRRRATPDRGPYDAEPPDAGQLPALAEAAVTPPPPMAAPVVVPVFDPSRTPISAPEVQQPVSGPVLTPLVIPSQAPWLAPQRSNPLAARPVTELHVEVTPIPLGGPFRIAKPEVRVGRDTSLELPLDAETVSQHHATLFLEADGELYVVDAGSTNGTYLEQERLPAGERRHVPPGSQLSFSKKIQLRVVQPWREQSASAPAQPVLGHVARRAMTVEDPDASRRRR